jgi:hypothetical protein
MDEALTQLLPHITNAARQNWNSNDREIETIIGRFVELWKSIDIDKLADGRKHSKNIADVIENEFIIELKPEYFGFRSYINMSEFVRTNKQHSIYQIIFENNAQKLVFEYVGTDYTQLEIELAKLYPGTRIGKSYDDIVVSKDYVNYNDMSDEFDNMKSMLAKINPIMAKQCIRKELETVNGVTTKAIRSRIEPLEHTTLMFPIVINVVNGNNNKCNIITGGNNNQITDEAKTREQLHRDWIIANPVQEGEFSQEYYNRLKQHVANPLCQKQHAPILRELGYTYDRTNKRRRWIWK